jgi:hypothetical protein
MKDNQIKVGDLVYHVTEAEFGIIYDIDIEAEAVGIVEPMAKIFWQIKQKPSIHYLANLTDKIRYNFIIHYPSET